MAEPITLSAQFFDGQQSYSFAAKITLFDDYLTIEYNLDSVKTLQWSIATLHVHGTPSLDREIIISNQTMPDARLKFENGADLTILLNKIPKKNQHHAHFSHPWRLVFSVSMVIIILFILTLYYLPYGASWIAKKVPYEWDKDFGSEILQAYLQNDSECIEPSGVAALQKLTERLTKQLNLAHPMIVKVVQTDPPIINAITVPGQQIVIFDGLLQFATHPDEVAGVLAHEIGHALAHHPTAGLIRQFGIQVILSASFGSTLDMASAFLHLKNSRHDEAQADNMAVSLLHQANISHQGLTDFFVKLAQQTNAANQQKWLNYLSAHPALMDRIEKTEQVQASSDTLPSLTLKQWRALKKICHKTKIIKNSKE